MLHSKQLSLLLCLTVSILFSCSKDGTLVESNSTPATEGEGVNVVFRLQSNVTAVLTRGTTPTSEIGDTIETGSEDEYNVKTARVYFFNNATKQFVKSVQLTSFKQQQSVDYSITYLTDTIKIEPGVYDIFVTANTNRIIEKATEDEFLADIDKETYSPGRITDISGGIVMSNRGSANIKVEIGKKNNSELDVNVIPVALERVLARLDVAVDKNGVFEMKDDNNNKYATISITGYYIVNLPKYYYTYRHTAELTSLVEPTWDLAKNFGDISDADKNGYLIDPYFFNKKVDATTFTNQDQYYANYFGDAVNPETVTWYSFSTKTSYCLENCMIAPAQKNGYSTGVIFRAKVEPNNNVYKYNSTTKALELIVDPNDYPNPIYYCANRFFNSLEAMEKYISTLDKSPVYHINPQKFDKVGNDYICYYNYWIRHLDNGINNVMGVMEFGIVRNNLYNIRVVDISDLGHGPDPDYTVPDTPDEGDAKLKVLVNVKKWIVRQLNIIL
jgi:hypothetical protein